jgi:hypothetical protein
VGVGTDVEMRTRTDTVGELSVQAQGVYPLSLNRQFVNGIEKVDSALLGADPIQRNWLSPVIMRQNPLIFVVNDSRVFPRISGLRALMAATQTSLPLYVFDALDTKTGTYQKARSSIIIDHFEQ